MGNPLAIIEPTPATREDFTRAHDPAFVDAILECQTMNGFRTRAADVESGWRISVTAVNAQESARHTRQHDARVRIGTSGVSDRASPHIVVLVSNALIVGIFDARLGYHTPKCYHSTAC
jgi:hypothetical protein